MFGSNFVYNVFQHGPATGMKKGDKASPSIILAGRALMVNNVHNFESHDMFGSNFVYNVF